MKKFSLLLVALWFCSIPFQGQNHQPELSSPWGNNFVHYYNCGGQETHHYIQDFLVHKLDNLTSGYYYLSLGETPSVFDYAYHEIKNYSNCVDLDNPYWIWGCSTPGTDTVVLYIEGENENLVAGTYEWITYTLRPPIPYDDAFGTVKVSVVAPYYITGSTLVCNSPVNFYLNEVPSTRTSVSWQIKQGSSVIYSGTGNTASSSSLSNGNYQVTYSMNFACGLNNLTPLNDPELIKNFHLGPYSSTDYPISGPSSAPCQSYVYYSMPQLEGETSVDWTWPQSWTYVSGQGTRSLALRTGNYGGTVAGRINNTCGQGGSYATKYTSVYGNCGFMILVTPNPSKNFINIAIKEPDISALDSIPNSLSQSYINEVNEYKIMISDRFGIVYNEFVTKEKTFNLSIQHLKQGNYIITASRSNIIFSAQLIVSD